MGGKWRGGGQRSEKDEREGKIERGRTYVEIR